MANRYWTRCSHLGYSFISPVLLLLSGGLVLRAQGDVDPPVPVTLQILTPSLDTRSAPATMELRARITDNLSGFRYANFVVYSPSGKQYVVGYASRVSGDALDGVYRIAGTVPMYVESGTWTIGYLGLADRVGNYRSYSTAELEARGFSVQIAIESDPDTDPPRVTSFTWSPSTVNVSSGVQSATLRIGSTDSPAGLSPGPSGQGCYMAAYMISPSKKQQRYLSVSDWTLVQGTQHDGVCEGRMPIAQFSEPGIWKLQTLYARDTAGNQLQVSAGDLEAAGISTDLTVESSPVDISPPALTGLSLSPGFIDTSTGPVFVTVRMTTRDDLSGLEFTMDTPSSFTHNRGANFSSPSGGQLVSSSPNQPKLVAGTPLNGTWQETLTFPQYSEEGTWIIYSVLLKDTTRNILQLNTAGIAALGLPTTLEVVRPTGTLDGAVNSAGGAVQDTTFGSRAQVVVPPGVLSATTNVAIDVLATPTTIAAPQGFQTANSAFVNIDFTPHPVMPLPAPGLTVTIPLSAYTAPGTSLTLFRVNPGSGTLIPAQSVSGGWVTGTADAGGYSATFGGITSLSTVVGMAPTQAMPGDLNGDSRVDCADVAIIKASYGKRNGQSGFDYRADVNRNGIVDINDLVFVTRLLPAGTKCQ